MVNSLIHSYHSNLGLSVNQNANLSPVPDPTFMDVPERQDSSTGPFELLQSALHLFLKAIQKLQLVQRVVARMLSNAPIRDHINISPKRTSYLYVQLK